MDKKKNIVEPLPKDLEEAIFGEIKQIDNHKSVFEIGSITKVMTSTILANLVYKGKIALDDPLQKHVPFKIKRPEKNGKTVTIKMLSNHTSGLTRMPSGFTLLALFNPENPYKNYDLNRMEKYFKRKTKNSIRVIKINVLF